MKKKPRTGSGVRTRGKAGAILKHILADEFLLSAATRDYYGNVTGSGFHGLQKLFDEQCREVEVWLAQVAARVLAAGAGARGGLRKLARLARISAPAGAGLAIRTMIAELQALHEGLAHRIRTDVAVCTGRLKDFRTANFLSDLFHFHDTMASQLKSLLESPKQEV